MDIVYFFKVYTCIFIQVCFHVAAQDCRFELIATTSTQTFQSPNYPRNHGNNLECIWNIRAERDLQVELKFVDIVTELDYDIIEIRDGQFLDSPLIAMLHGIQPQNENYFSSNGRLTVIFITDRSVNSKGFNATFRTALRQSLNIEAVIQSDLASTKVESRIYNDNSDVKEIQFSYILPYNALITSFRMMTSGVMYRGVIEVKREALGKYDGAYVRGITSTIVTSQKDTMKQFQVRMNVEPGQELYVQLNYREVLIRTMSKYTYLAVVNREQLFGDIKVNVYLCANAEIAEFSVAPVQKGKLKRNSVGLPPGVTITQNGNYLHMNYQPPTPTTQPSELATPGGNFELQYSYDLPPRSGILYIQDNYFIHSFAPQLPEIPRTIVFVLDVSGSMAGTKIDQVKTAMSNILRDLSLAVSFNIVLFESVVRVWRNDRGLVQATRRNIDRARNFIRNIEPDGGTNINEALLTGLNLLQRGGSIPVRFRSNISPLKDFMIFLTDGKPTIGPRRSDVILRNVRRQNREGFGIHSIGFGENVDIDFLQRLAEENNGRWRQIFENVDADVQIQNFMATLGPPLLLNVEFDYSRKFYNRITKLTHPVLRLGEEIVVSGQLNSSIRLSEGDIVRLRYTAMTNQAVSGIYELVVHPLPTCSQLNDVISPDGDVTENVYAVLRINELLEDMSSAESEMEKRVLRKEAIELSIRYNLVTNVTALVITAPDQPVDPSSTPQETTSTQPTITPTQPTPPVTSSSPTNQITSADVGNSDFPSANIDSFPWIFQGDPHFVIRLSHEVSACFTWGGKPGQVYSLLYDPVNQIRVNGLVVKAPARPTDEIRQVVCDKKLPETYFHTLSFIFEKEKMAFVVNPHNVTILDNTNNKRTKVATKDASDESYSFSNKFTQLKIFGVSKMHSFVNVTLKGRITFIVNLHRLKDKALLNHTKPQGDHVDLDVEGADNLSLETKGVFGEFSYDLLRNKKKRARVVSGNDDNILIYKNRHFPVQHFDLADPLRRKHFLHCWFTCDADEFLGEKPNYFEVANLLNSENFNMNILNNQKRADRF